MGKKQHEAARVSEPVVEESPDCSAIKAEKKKMKKKKDKQNEDSPKRKLEEVEVQDSTEPKTKKSKKHKKSRKKSAEEIVAVETNGTENGREDESVRDEHVVVTGKNIEDENPERGRSCRDLIGIAATGSGKTLAFGIPAMMHVLGKRKGKASKGRNPLCLVLSPTRELAQQISDVMCDAGTSCGVESICLYGGTSKGPQISLLKSGINIVIGTPGRIEDLIEMGVHSLKEVSFVVLDEADRMLDMRFEQVVRSILGQTRSGLLKNVLDEADRMLDMGFEQVVRSILGQTCSVRQMVMFSATWPLAVHNLAQEFMDPNPVKVVIGSEDLAANQDVMQIVEVLDDRSRDKRLVALLEKYHKS
ncbi:hypothetical protein K1719_044443 [Acacia pycnantha]|nr:hypothetical protein K1719_044443 [Acacia pycnantha]